MNRLKQLEQYGQSVWLDFLSREFLASDRFRSLISEDGLKGMTSNPSIFEKAFSHGTEYDADIASLAADGSSVAAIFRRLSVHDIQTATDALRPVYDATHAADGYVSIEVSPYLAYDTDASIAEGRALWAEIGRPNLMIKIPGTREGLPAIRTLLGEGINVNITLLFAQARYEEVVEAYLSGLEILATKQELDFIASVASFFVSRIDTKTDGELDKKFAQAGADTRSLIESLKGKTAIANAKLAYQYYKQAFASERWEKLAKLGARPQRLLWASTSTKNKAYSDVLYVDSLIGPNTVNTIPLETLDAFRDHGHPAATLDADVDEARKTLAGLDKARVSLEQITNQLVTEGVELFAKAADQLYGALAAKRAKILGAKLLRLESTLGSAQSAVDNEVAQWATKGNIRRLWGRDKTLWTNADEDRWLGWLDITARERADTAQLDELARQVKDEGTEHVVLLGMGGSSLGAEVLGDTFGHLAGWPQLHVLDSTDPEQILAVQHAIKPGKTLFLVSSKSGTTLEPNILRDHFMAVTREAEPPPAQHFVAITDPGTALEQEAKRDGFKAIFHGDPAIGGRYSVLSNFGLVPAAATGIDFKRLLQEAEIARQSCADMVPPSVNPGVQLGAALGVLARDFGRDKITIIASPAIGSLGTWLEQLIAESTGKLGKGLVPIDKERLSDPSAYGPDRVFVHLELASHDEYQPRLDALAGSGHPVLRLVIDDVHQIAQMFFVWEIAIAVAGAVIGINPFDQPDVEEAKKRTRELTDQMEHGDDPLRQRPDYVHDGVAVFADAAIRKDCTEARSLADCLRAHLSRIHEKDYFALLAYVPPTPEHASTLEDLRLGVRDRKHVATCLEFGPRYLHSTGQAYKGGPNSGVFLTLTCDHAEDVPLENSKLTFGSVQLAQAVGDFEVLNDRKRRVVRLHLHDLPRGLDALRNAVNEALG
ncbi:MAG TPA: bifunctional transaldolase/phosoglucose isomerase [Rhizomicrobium sp.]|jgi:transaldolase/glucose-6-phosphate isomerase|nr:bifunctional transaldolase/phosoglucose isomerase [Rhizomicrobium sp.]